MGVVFPVARVGYTIDSTLDEVLFSYFFPRIVLYSWLMNHKRELLILHYLLIFLFFEQTLFTHFVYQTPVLVAF